MSKLDGYSSEDQVFIKQIMPLLLEVRLGNGQIEQTNEAIKAAMPGTFEMAAAVVANLNNRIEAYSMYDEGTVRRVKVLTLKLLLGQVETSRGVFDQGDLLRWLASAFDDARQVAHAVDEYLHG